MENLESTNIDSLDQLLYVKLSSHIVIVPSVYLRFSIHLNHINYLLWHEQLLTIIHAYGLEKFIDPSQLVPLSTIPSTNLQNPEYDEQSRMNGIVKSWILGYFTQSVSPYLINNTTIAKYWSTLAKKFANISHDRVMDLKLHLQTIRKEGSTIEDSRIRIKYEANHLTVISETVPKRDLILCVVIGLDISYNFLNSTISMQLRTLKFDEVHSLILSHERMLEHQAHHEKT